MSILYLSMSHCAIFQSRGQIAAILLKVYYTAINTPLKPDSKLVRRLPNCGRPHHFKYRDYDVRHIS